jgi:hypothetical protein
VFSAFSTALQNPALSLLAAAQPKTADNMQIDFEPSFGAGSIKAKPAFFGVVPYGHTIRAQLVYGSPGNRDGCQRLDPSEVKNWPMEGEMDVVLVLNRGGCPFKTKVRDVQTVRIP